MRVNNINFNKAPDVDCAKKPQGVASSFDEIMKQQLNTAKPPTVSDPKINEKPNFVEKPQIDEKEDFVGTNVDATFLMAPLMINQMPQKVDTILIDVPLIVGEIDSNNGANTENLFVPVETLQNPQTKETVPIGNIVNVENVVNAENIANIANVENADNIANVVNAENIPKVENMVEQVADDIIPKQKTEIEANVVVDKGLGLVNEIKSPIKPVAQNPIEQGNLQNNAQTLDVAQLGQLNKAQNQVPTVEVNGQADFQQQIAKPVENLTEIPQENMAIEIKTTELDFDKVNIKVGENAQVDTPKFTQEIAEKISVKLNENAKEFDIELNPRELGKISIKILFTAQEAIVSLSCTNAKTQSLLAANSDNIRNIIESNVGQQTMVTVEENSDVGQYRDNGDLQQESQNKQDAREQERKQYTKEQNLDFINKLRLGLVDFVNAT